jgi:aminoglycoside phosphotransferase (APT) family kinase protein
MECVWKTPRFHASRHVVVLLMPPGTSEPMLVAKAARLRGDSSGVDREAHALSDIHGRGARMGDTIPRLVGVVDCHGHPVLVQTALRGKPLDPGVIRRDRDNACADVASWIIKLHRSTLIEADERGTWFETHVEKPLRLLETVLGDSDDDRRILDQARVQLEALRDQRIPYVVEHGDLSHPNLFRLHSGEIGVIDWELADVYGIPLADLYFFLTYAACAASGSRSDRGQLQAFENAFFGESPWTRSYVEKYARELQLPHNSTGPLFVLTWTRYLAGLAQRLACEATSSSPAGDNGKSSADWLRANRYHSFWRRAVAGRSEPNTKCT